MHDMLMYNVELTAIISLEVIFHTIRELQHWMYCTNNYADVVV